MNYDYIKYFSFLYMYIYVIPSYLHIPLFRMRDLCSDIVQIILNIYIKGEYINNLYIYITTTPLHLFENYKWHLYSLFIRVLFQRHKICIYKILISMHY